MNKFKNSHNLEKVTEICKEIDPNVIQKEVENQIIKLSQISDKKLEGVAGGKMDFNKMKTFALAALLPFAMASTIGVAHAMKSAEVSPAMTSEEKKEEEILLKVYIFSDRCSFLHDPISPLPSNVSGDDYLIKLYKNGVCEVSYGGKQYGGESKPKWISSMLKWVSSSKKAALYYHKKQRLESVSHSLA